MNFNTLTNGWVDQWQQLDLGAPIVNGPINAPNGWTYVYEIRTQNQEKVSYIGQTKINPITNRINQEGNFENDVLFHAHPPARLPYTNARLANWRQYWINEGFGLNLHFFPGMTCESIINGNNLIFTINGIVISEIEVDLVFRWKPKLLQSRALLPLQNCSVETFLLLRHIQLEGVLPVANLSVG